VLVSRHFSSAVHISSLRKLCRSRLNNSMLRMRGHVTAALFSLWRPILARNTQWFSSYCCKCVQWIIWIRSKSWCFYLYNQNLHTASMTLNDFERRNSPFCVFSPNSIPLQADYVTVVENTPIMSVKYCLPVPVFHFCPKLTHPAAQSLCDSWATC